MTLPDARNWRKPARSFSNGNCVEVASCPCDADPGFRTPRRSIGNGECVEAGNAPAGVLVRDTKDRGGAVLAFGPAEWMRYIGSVKAGAA